MTTENSTDALLKRLKDGETSGDEALVLDQRKNLTIRVTGQDLLAAIEKNPKHPVAKVYAGVMQRFRPDNELTVDKVDLQGLLENREVLLKTEIVNGAKVFKKSLAPEKASPAKAESKPAKA